jgi:ABC-type transport system substrate-binding protein
MKLPTFKFIKKIFSLSYLKGYPWKDSFQSLKFLPRVFSRLEKIVLLGLFGVVIFGSGWLSYCSWLGGTKLVAAPGGQFREGLVGESKDLDKNLARLVNAGLTKYDKDKNIVGDIADKWEIKNDGKVYEFHLRDGFNSQDLASQILAKNIWQDIDISTSDPQILRFTFKQPFSPFLYTSTAPIFPYGPYRIAKESKNEVDLAANENYYDGRPYLNTIIIKLYSNQDEVIKAAKRGDIDGFGLPNDLVQIDGFSRFEMSLPRDLILFFNLSRPALQDKNVREALKENRPINKELNLRLVTSDSPKNLEIAKKMIDKWNQNNIKITLDVKDNVTLQKTTIPKRDYDLLLYGLDYGEDPDPYPFWHSSQIKEDGMNLSNFKNLQADRLLEEARQEFDFKKREEDYAAFEKILDAEIPMFVVEHQNYYYHISKKIFGIDYIVGTNEADRFLNVASWYNETKRVKK